MKLTTEKADSVFVITIEGIINSQTSPELEPLLKKNYSKYDTIILDFSNVDYISSSGLRILLLSHNSMNDKNGRFEIRNISESVRNLLEMTGFTDILNIK